MAKSASRSPGKPATSHDQKPARGNGGELHQIAEGEGEILTTAQGGPVAGDQNTLKAGQRGPALIEDFHFQVTGMLMQIIRSDAAASGPDGPRRGCPVMVEGVAARARATVAPAATFYEAAVTAAGDESCAAADCARG